MKPNHFVVAAMQVGEAKPVSIGVASVAEAWRGPLYRCPIVVGSNLALTPAQPATAIVRLGMVFFASILNTVNIKALAQLRYIWLKNS